MINWLQTRVCQELGQEYGSRLWMDAQENIRLYAYYDGTGQEWATPAGLDYRPNKTIVNHTKRLIDKVSGFMFSRAPEITLKPVGDDQANAKRVAELEQHIRENLQQNGWQRRLLQAGRDCFVGKRVALKVGIYQDRLVIRFRPSVEFFHDVSVDDVEKLERIIFAYGMNDKKEPEAQRIWVQSWRMEDGRCLLTEGVYNGYGITVEENVVTVDYLTLNAGTYRFTTSETESLHQRPLGTVTQESIPASGKAYMRRQTIELDGKNVTLQTYALPGANGGETNYVRLRDVASLLSGTKAQFSVDWDGNVVIVPDASYVSNGTELKAPFSGDRRYQKADAKTVIYGESIPFTAILLTDDQGGGYTYYKLRDLGKVLNFNVSWSANRGIYIESSRAYEG